jgi:hypothetical protein
MPGHGGGSGGAQRFSSMSTSTFGKPSCRSPSSTTRLSVSRGMPASPPSALMTSRSLLAGTPVTWMATPGIGPTGFAGFGGSAFQEVKPVVMAPDAAKRCIYCNSARITAQTTLPGPPSSSGYQPSLSHRASVSSSPRPLSSSAPGCRVCGAPGWSSRMRIANSPRSKLRMSRMTGPPAGAGSYHGVGG